MRSLLCYSLLVLSFSLIAQEGNRFPEGIEEAVYQRRSAGTDEVDKPRVEPPFWWVGMTAPQVEILIHDTNIRDLEPKIDYPGISIQNVTRLQSPNYLFVEVQIAPGTNAGSFPIVLSDANGGEAKRYNYELKNRNTTPSHVQGVDASDFIYLIMPDRFANGDKGNDEVASMRQTGIDRENVFFRHGGDLLGIMEHLDYLESLGVTALWLNPVLENDQPYDSYHGYAVTDHYSIDARFGDNELYKQFVELCHSRGIKVIMDVIFNHVGDQHWFIRDLPDESWIHQFDEFTKTTYRAPALMDPNGAKDDFNRMRDGWFDNHMPDLNQKHPQLANFLIQNSIWWTEYSGQDGFRIDTYAYSDDEFNSNWNKRLLAEFPELGIYAETWVHGAPIQAWFTQGRHLHADWNSKLPGVTDFQLYYAINEALAREQGWTEGVSRIYYTLAQDFLYKHPQRNVLFLDNHDLGRYFEGVGQDMTKYKSGLALLLTMRGIPMIYYGTELLFTGSGGAFGEGGRVDFPGGWSKDKVNKFKEKDRTEEEQAAFNYVQKLANYRKKTSALHQGKMTQYVPENNVYVYFRYDSDKTVMVLFNSGNSATEAATNRYQESMAGFGRAWDVIGEKELNDLSSISLGAKEVKVLELRP